MGGGISSFLWSIRLHPKIIAINQGKKQLIKFRRLLTEFDFVPINEILSMPLDPSGLDNFCKLDSASHNMT